MARRRWTLTAVSAATLMPLLAITVVNVASVLCALAPGATFLDLPRPLQGVGGAATLAVSLALVAHEVRAVPEPARA